MYFIYYIIIHACLYIIYLHIYKYRHISLFTLGVGVTNRQPLI